MDVSKFCLLVDENAKTIVAILPADKIEGVHCMPLKVLCSYGDLSAMCIEAISSEDALEKAKTILSAEY